MTAFDGLGTALRALRERRRLTQAEAGRRMGIGQSRLSAYEGGEPMDVKTLDRILDAYEADVVELGRLLRRGRDGEREDAAEREFRALFTPDQLDVIDQRVRAVMKKEGRKAKS